MPGMVPAPDAKELERIIFNYNVAQLEKK